MYVYLHQADDNLIDFSLWIVFRKRIDGRQSKDNVKNKIKLERHFNPLFLLFGFYFSLSLGWIPSIVQWNSITPSLKENSSNIFCLIFCLRLGSSGHIGESRPWNIEMKSINLFLKMYDFLPGVWLACALIKPRLAIARPLSLLRLVIRARASKIASLNPTHQPARIQSSTWPFGVWVIFISIVVICFVIMLK